MDTKQKFRRKSPQFELLEQQQQKKRRRRIAFYVVMLTAFTAAFFAMWFLVFFKVKDIEIQGNARYTASEIADAAGIKVGDNLYSVSSDELLQRLSTAMPYIRSVKLERRLPSTISITVEEERAVMYSRLYGDVFLISENMTVLERTSSAPDGMIELSAGEIKRCFVGEELTYVENRMNEVIAELYHVLEVYGIADKIDSFSIKNRFDINLRYDDRIDVYLGSIENSDIKVRFFIGILEHLYEDEKGRLDISNIKEASFSRY